MPIQPLNIAKYNQIPEVEDVTPLDRSIAKKEQKSFKAIAVVLACAVIVAALLFFGWKVSSNWRNPVRVIQTSMITGDRLKELGTNEFESRGFPVKSMTFGSDEDHTGKAKVVVDSAKAFQEIIGFGGAFTEAAAYNFYKLPKSVREKVIDLYFGDNSIGYTLGRVHINSCDFSLKSYSFDDIEGDYSLQYFDTEVTHDNAQMIPFILEAMDGAKSLASKKGSKQVPNGVNLLASPWSPPLWMKEGGVNRSMTGSSEPHGLIDDEKTKMAWATYFAKWIDAYSNKGVPIWAVTPQNEPEFAVSDFMAECF
jgi:O-glycosyl hydrolase